VCQYHFGFPSGAGAGDSTALDGRYSSHQTTRLNALFGFRDISFMQAAGFESLDGFQDMRKGIEIATLVGTGLEALGADEHDTFVSADVYTGRGSPRAFAAVEVMAEGRRPENGGEWTGFSRVDAQSLISSRCRGIPS
jgi:hypothetical protein